MDHVEREYEYRPGWALVIFGALFFGACAIVLGVKAASNEQGLIINRIIEFGPEGATGFYWTICALSIGFVVITLILACRRMLLRQRIAFGPAAMIVPASSWSSEENEIAYRDIATVSASESSGQQFLSIVHASGKFTLVASMLPSKAAYEEIGQLLAEKIRAARSELLSSTPQAGTPVAKSDPTLDPNVVFRLRKLRRNSPSQQSPDAPG